MWNICKKLAGSKAAVFLAAVLLVVGYGFRVVHLDQDLPPWGVALYQPKDEGCYAIMAVNEWEYGMLNPDDPGQTGVDYPMYIPEHIRVNILGNLLQIAGLHLFGDNYYGFRMPMVLIGLLNLIVLGVILLELRKRYGRGSNLELWGILGLLLLMSTHFYFYISSRTVEPSTLRMLFTQFIMLVWLKSRKKGRLCFFLMGVCITASVFLVYITNVFLYLAAGLLLLMIWKIEGNHTFFQDICAFAAGSVILYIVSAIYYRSVWDTSPVKNMLKAIGLFRNVSGYQITGDSSGNILRSLLKGAIKYFSANFFLYAPALLGLLFLIFPFAVWYVIREKDATIFFFLTIPISFLLQTMVSEDYIWRKFLVVAPFVMYIIYWGALSWPQIESLLMRYRLWCKEIPKKNIRILAKIIIPAGIACTVCVTAFLMVFHLALTNDLSKIDFAVLDKFLILGVGYFPFLLWGGWMFTAMLLNKRLPVKQAVCLLGGTTLLVNVGLLYHHVWKAPTFEERNMMVSLSEEHGLDGKYVVGDFSMGITLYNDLKPVMEHYSNYGSRITENPDMFLFHYATDSSDFRSYLDTVLFDPLSDYAGNQVAVIPGTLQVYGVTRDFALYKAKPRADVVREERQKYEEAILRIQRELNELELQNSDFDWEELGKRKHELKEELNTYFQYYPDHYGERVGDILSPIYVDSYGDIRGDICAPVYGRIYGDIYGDIKSTIYGDIYGDIYGNIYEPIEGQMYGELYGQDFSKAKYARETMD